MNKLYDFHCDIFTNNDRIINFDIYNLTLEEFNLIKNQLHFIIDKFISIKYSCMSFVVDNVSYEIEKKL